MDEKSAKEYMALFLEKWKAVERVSEEYARVAGLTPMSLHVLTIIYDNSEDCTQKLICQQSLYNKQTVNMIIKSFWEQGHVELAEMKEDRRNKQVRLSEKGKKYAEKVNRILFDIGNNALERISQEQQKALIAFLEAYEQCFRRGVDTLAEAIHTTDREGDDD